MSKRISKKSWAAAAAVLAITLCVSAVYAVKRYEASGAKVPDRAERKLELSAWLVDWQWKAGMDDMRSIANGLAGLQVFAAYFDSTGSLYFNEDSRKAMPQIVESSRQSGLVNVDLTVVNDRVNRDGSSIQKDSALITKLMATEESRNKHIQEILDAVAKYNLHGVEIDYEKIDDQDWNNVILFYKEIYQRLHGQGKSLRIVLEPRTPIERIKLPEGPAYVMMAYSLYGNHSGPGPKADQAFIAKLARRMDQVPGDNFIALSAGGFDWGETGKVTALTEKRAAELSRKSIGFPKRDAESGSLYFDYMDDHSVKHTVWYADSVTLSQWIDISRRAGYHKIALWRLGDLGQATLQVLNR